MPSARSPGPRPPQMPTASVRTNGGIPCRPPPTCRRFSRADHPDDRPPTRTVRFVEAALPSLLRSVDAGTDRWPGGTRAAGERGTGKQLRRKSPPARPVIRPVWSAKPPAVSAALAHTSTASSPTTATSIAHPVRAWRSRGLPAGTRVTSDARPRQPGPHWLRLLGISDTRVRAWPEEAGAAAGTIGVLRRLDSRPARCFLAQRYGRDWDGHRPMIRLVGADGAFEPTCGGRTISPPTKLGEQRLGHLVSTTTWCCAPTSRMDQLR